MRNSGCESDHNVNATIMGKKKTHKVQHWIPRSYLSDWHDPNCPAHYTPYINTISKDGSAIKQRAPVNIFTENELYTIITPQGHRDLRLEHGLNGLETAFADIRRRFLRPHKQLPKVPYLKLLAFVAAMLVRTPSMRDHHARYWNEVKEVGEQMEEQMAKASPLERKALARTLSPSGNHNKSMTLDEVREIAANPMQHILEPMIRGQLRFLVVMQCDVWCTEHENGFITSDDPVVWFDPEAYKRPPLMRNPGLAMPKIEISFPISPQQCLVITHGTDIGKIRYLEAPDRVVSEINRRTRFRCDSHFVSRLGYLEPNWFDPGEEPPDSWEKVHDANNAQPVK